jgi:hypothetical protein
MPPTFTTSPAASASPRARAYETTIDAPAPASAANSTGVSRKRTARPPNMRSSPTRSSVESRNAPALLERPVARATRPSMKSKLEPNRKIQPPSDSQPKPMRTAAAQTTSVEARVIASGDSPSRRQSRSTGVQSQIHHSWKNFARIVLSRCSMYASCFRPNRTVRTVNTRSIVTRNATRPSNGRRASAARVVTGVNVSTTRRPQQGIGGVAPTYSGAISAARILRAARST